jgi:hypothetical protein
MTTRKPVREIGIDGWPSDLPSEAEQAAEIERIFREDLQVALGHLRERLQIKPEHLHYDDFRAFTFIIQLCCRRHPEIFPYELIAMSERLVQCALAEDEKRARRLWNMHLTRWEMVTELLERGPKLIRDSRENVARVKKLISAAKVTDEKSREERNRLLELLPKLIEVTNDYRRSGVERASRAVSKALKATGARGGYLAVQTSYQLIEAAGGRYATFQSYQEELLRRAEMKKLRRQRKLR